MDTSVVDFYSMSYSSMSSLGGPWKGANASFYSKPYYPKWLFGASHPFQQWFQAENLLLLNIIKPNSTVLDMGCGWGRHLSLLLRKKFLRSAIGVDNEPSMIRAAKRSLSKFDSILRVIQTDASHTGLANQSCDYVICMTNTLGNMQDPQGALNEMARVLKERGVGIISVYRDSGKVLKLRALEYKKVCLNIRIRGNTIYAREGLVSRQFNTRLLNQLFRRAGLLVTIVPFTSIAYLALASRWRTFLPNSDNLKRLINRAH